jgi:hypothetical protein
MTIMDIIKILSENIGLLNNFLLIAFFATFAHLFMKESKNDKSPLLWTDMLLDSKTNKLSISKLGQFWGISISSWVAIYMAQKLTPDQIASMYPWIFGTWLAFLVSNSGIKAFTAIKRDAKEETKEEDSK